MTLNEYINFEQMFEDIIESFKDEWNDLMWNDDTDVLYNVYKFTQNNNFDLLIVKDECELTDEHIIFVFGEEFDSYEYSSEDYRVVYIVYDRKEDNFTSYEVNN